MHSKLIKGARREAPCPFDLLRAEAVGYFHEVGTLIRTTKIIKNLAQVRQSYGY
jgi:hypothetical protein